MPASRALLAYVLALCSLFLLWRRYNYNGALRPGPPSPSRWQSSQHATLVVYILSLADERYLGNFLFFHHEAILRDTTARYDVLVAREDRKNPLLPKLPPHARYVSHDRGCGGLSLVRWYLRDGPGASPDALGAVSRVVLVTSAVRGPFIPPGLKSMVTWHLALGAGLSSEPPRGSGRDRGRDRGGRGGGGGGGGGRPAALAGGVVSCVQPADSLQSDPLLPPFLEFTALAATRASIDVLLGLPEDGDALPACPSAREAAARAAGEREAAAERASAAVAANASTAPALVAAALASKLATEGRDAAAVLSGDGLTAPEAAAAAAARAWSSALLAEGWGLASLAPRQQGADWADRQLWTCNAGVSPLLEHSDDGVTVSPYLAMFLPFASVDEVDVPFGTPQELVATYSAYLQAEAAEREPPSVAPSWLPNSSALLRPALTERNRYFALAPVYKLPAVLFMIALGQKCFDAEHFKQANPDIVPLTDDDLWKFFLFIGQFQPRAYHLKCGMDWAKFGLKKASGGRLPAASGAAGASPPSSSSPARSPSARGGL
ncbi:hypothetical protein HYH03_018587 [Edaphochlamys debaryana]|uniref:Uncharacterized protein n=1 Tax=Edaphochlamys debaryana TaxID=47281 RepID=A0A835XJY9_9CHLO|nr:hypothetical protein HYH03_018587 [Edaphochlamys debaryana]|eukprot:KAG2482480.1 hypothetical protein HYH03_018587 [Edaphochlamys debaryana]